MNTTNTRYPIAETGGDLARRTTAGVAVAVLASLAVLAIVGALNLQVGAAGPMSPFAAVPVVMSTVVSGVGAAVAYAVLVRLTGRPVRNFVTLAAVVFLGMLGPVFVVTPSLGVTPVGQLVLVVLHATVAGPLVAFIIGIVRL